MGEEIKVWHDQEGDYLEVMFAKQLSDLFIEGHYTFADIDDEEYEVCGVDALVYLVFDVFAEFVGVDDAVSAGVDEFEEAVVCLYDCADSVARDAGCRVDDAYHTAGQRVEQAALSNVGSAYYCDYRYCHRLYLVKGYIERGIIACLGVICSVYMCLGPVSVNIGGVFL